MKTVAYIPARGGSKRIPRKNIRDFAGIPALGRVIQIASSTNLFDHVIVSTDSEEIAEVARRFGAHLIDRDPMHADDHTGLLEVVQADLPPMANTGIDPHVVACILPTAVLMSQEDLAAAVKTVMTDTSPFVVAVGRFSYPIQRALRMSERAEIEMIWPENYAMRSQDLEPCFHDAGQFYVGTADAWGRRRTMFATPTTARLIDDRRVMDIDVEEDWLRAEQLWHLLQAE
jgi:pseudaminic acid cytidylyltransferase